MMLFTGTMILALHLYLKQIITLPVQSLSSAAEKISKGNFDINLGQLTNDELGKLGENLTNMSYKLKAYYTNLRQSIKYKEAEIRKNKEFEAQKDDFMNIASHELKTPVTSLKIYTQLMQQLVDKHNDGEYQRFLDKMSDQINKLTGLISDLLDVTRIQAGKMPLAISHFNLSKCITDNIEVLQASTFTHQIHFHNHLQSKVYGDRDRISQVVNNLLTNAIKYSPQSDHIIVTASNEKDRIVVGVQDFGIGIQKKNQLKIFDRFFRVIEADEKTYPGLGIGLYISSEIIKRHHGKIWVKSEKGKGSLFCFSLPANSQKVV
jgi:signal transduction histidine kinase